MIENVAPINLTNGGGSGNYGGGFGAGDPYNYGGSGGYVGGYSLDGTSNWSGYTGVGSSVGYNAFTPNFSLIPTPTINEPLQTEANTSLPDWLRGIFTGIFNRLPILLSFGNDGSTAQATLSGHNYAGNVYTKNGQYYLNLNGDTSLITKTATGIETTNLTSPQNGFVDYLGGNGAVTPTPTTTTTDTAAQNQSILDQLSNLLSGGAPSSATFEAPPNLYQVTPTGASSTTGASSMPKILILIAVIAAGYFLYKKYA